jgi:hypothetical protein
MIIQDEYYCCHLLSSLDDVVGGLKMMMDEGEIDEDTVV